MVAGQAPYEFVEPIPMRPIPNRSGAAQAVRRAGSETV